jgi:hypothetical protein
MYNVGEKSALGASAYAAADDEGSRWGLKARFRRWISRKVSLDIAPGILLNRIESRYEQYPGFTGHVGLNVNWVTITTQFELIPVQDYIRNEAGNLINNPGYETSIYAGLKLNSDPGWVACLTSVLMVPWLVRLLDPQEQFHY